ncbi:MAG: hypothetical protein RLZZ522_1232 [Verrucomicrobiota bacterium]|jgi:hypothetical protein
MKAPPDLAAAARQVREIYAEWEQPPLPRHCTGVADCCRFKRTSRTPVSHPRRGAGVAARAWKAAGRKDVAVPADGSCPMRYPTTGQCRIYAGRTYPVSL